MPLNFIKKRDTIKKNMINRFSIAAKKEKMELASKIKGRKKVLKKAVGEFFIKLHILSVIIGISIKLPEFIDFANPIKSRCLVTKIAIVLRPGKI